jgi:hypothetical protein
MVPAAFWSLAQILSNLVWAGLKNFFESFLLLQVLLDEALPVFLSFTAVT